MAVPDRVGEGLGFSDVPRSTRPLGQGWDSPGSPSFLGFSWKCHKVGMVPPLEGAVGASRGQRRLLQPDKPWKRGGSPAPAPRREPLLCRRGVRPQREPRLPSRWPTRVEMEIVTLGYYVSPRQLDLILLSWGTDIVFSTRPFPGQKAAAEGGWQRCWGEKGSSLWHDSKDRNSRLLHPFLTRNQRYI